MKGLCMGHFIYRAVEGVNDRRRQRLSHIADSKPDNVLFWIGFLKSRHFFANRGKEVTSW